MPDVKVHLFARPREICGAAMLEMELAAPATVQDCFAALVAAHADLEPLQRRLMAAVNERYADWDTRLHDGDEVAFIPPVSGGSTGPATAR